MNITLNKIKYLFSNEDYSTYILILKQYPELRHIIKTYCNCKYGKQCNNIKVNK